MLSGGKKLDAAGLPCGVQVDQTLVGAAAEAQGDILQLLHIAAVNQNIQQGEQFIRRLTAGMAALRQQFVVGEAGKAPDGLSGKSGADPADKGEQYPLVFRLKGLAAQQGKTVDIVRTE